MDARLPRGLLLAGLYVCVGCGAPSREGGTAAEAGDTERALLTNTSVSAGAARELPHVDPSGALEQEGVAVPPGAPAPSSRGTTVDAGAHGIAADAGSRASECPYPNYPPTEWSPGPWIPVATSDAAELLAGVQAAMPGRWQGLATSPWTTPYRVEIGFTADGHYSGRCTELSSDCCLAFYYGSDDDSPIKRYRVEDATLSGNVFGEIDVAFAYDDEYGLPGWQGELTNIRRDASGNGLRFSFSRSDGYGPVEYDLRRVPSGE